MTKQFKTVAENKNVPISIAGKSYDEVVEKSKKEFTVEGVKRPLTDIQEDWLIERPMEIKHCDFVYKWDQESLTYKRGQVTLVPTDSGAQNITKFEVEHNDNYNHMLQHVCNDFTKAKFILFKPVVAQLLMGFMAKQNVVLYGKGGHGKSEMVILFLKSMGIFDDTFIKNITEETPASEFMGGLNMKVLRDTGEQVYNTHNSMFMKSYALLEELFDAPSSAIGAIKDPFTSGRIRNGNQNVPIKLEWTVVCTNWSKEDLEGRGDGNNNSAKALFERFQRWSKVEWTAYTKDVWKALFKAKFGDEIEELAELIEDCHVANNFISPRTGVHMAKAYIQFGPGGIIGMTELDEKEIKQWAAKIDGIRKQTMLRNNLKDWVTKTSEFVKEAEIAINKNKDSGELVPSKVYETIKNNKETIKSWIGIIHSDGAGAPGDMTIELSKTKDKLSQALGMITDKLFELESITA